MKIMAISIGSTYFTSRDHRGARPNFTVPWLVISFTAFLVFHTQPMNTQARIAPIGRDTLETKWSAKSKILFPRIFTWLREPKLNALGIHTRVIRIPDITEAMVLEILKVFTAKDTTTSR